jgi:hypothetical protein
VFSRWLAERSTCAARLVSLVSVVSVSASPLLPFPPPLDFSHLRGADRTTPEDSQSQALRKCSPGDRLGRRACFGMQGVQPEGGAGRGEPLLEVVYERLLIANPPASAFFSFLPTDVVSPSHSTS